MKKQIFMLPSRGLLVLPALVLLAPVAAYAPPAYATLPAAVIPAADTSTAAASGGNATANPGPSITGFRNASFGMTQAQVRHVVQAEFRLPASAIKAGEDNVQHTALLNVEVPELIPGGGIASVSYVFGYQSHKLIEISIVWSKSIDANATPQQIYQNAVSLRQYFAAEGFPPQRSSGNIATSDGLILFRATDSTGNAIGLILSGTMTKDPKSDKTILQPAALTLAYISDSQHPDIFKLNKGSF